MSIYPLDPTLTGLGGEGGRAERGGMGGMEGAGTSEALGGETDERSRDTYPDTSEGLWLTTDWSPPHPVALAEPPVMYIGHAPPPLL